ncbi:hypothetical protein AVEN_148115-1 [Araneus ventricosus]|uniref:Uncharacterized protein n=1 Tax=Araneus ventricosus TaxID=182803 RepID=A0A4Y2VQV7_ARAVE|nr:hypothetical protein AVEN_148115-1 [Araneus ventricosus]
MRTACKMTCVKRTRREKKEQDDAYRGAGHPPATVAQVTSPDRVTYRAWVGQLSFFRLDLAKMNGNNPNMILDTSHYDTPLTPEIKISGLQFG